MAAARKIPFPFITDLLFSANPVIRPMFGGYGVYVHEKIVLMLRDRENHPEANGVWIATTAEHHASLKKEIPSMHSIYLLSGGKGETQWQMIQKDADDFESSAAHLCKLILRGDERVGRIPKPKKKKQKK